jgi:hypothetical protein
VAEVPATACFFPQKGCGAFKAGASGKRELSSTATHDAVISCEPDFFFDAAKCGKKRASASRCRRKGRIALPGAGWRRAAILILQNH